jgi:hypothetical protein
MNRHPMWTEPLKTERTDEGGLMPIWMWNVATVLARNLVRFDGRPNSEPYVQFAMNIYDECLARSQSQAECVGWLTIETRQTLANWGLPSTAVISDLSRRLIDAALEGVDVGMRGI